ncbi:hypothetical protein FLAG1_08176 [Fusarium langsethiae]|uniref:Uncharacterized protein n=1 Tax=Fusarium langsethiae TaxID=179993 RepID=A0A0N0V5V9_FUSLA|nr:hypothetical protein FLAG1_08176 [Fusarium langsethiae]GKU05939.1 unnamed protein product [Fusarium langsethiae]
MFKDELGKADSQSAMDESGDVFEIPRFSEPYLRFWHLGGACSNILCYPSSLSVSYNMPLPVPWPDCAYDMMKNRSWHTLSRDSDSGIDLIYLPNYCAEEMLFDEATRASEPYFSAIFGSGAPFYEPIAVPYMNMADGEVRISMTDPYMDDSIDLPADTQWAGEEWSEHSDMDRFVFAFYQRHSYIQGMEYNRRCQFMAIEFTGLDPDLRKKFN